MRGILSVYKPVGVTSADVTNVLRRILTSREPPGGSRLKVGHGGVLDKLAEGVLVIGVGEDCNKLGNYLHGDKAYVATGVLGTSTTTHDRGGEVAQTLPFEHVSKRDLERMLKSMKGRHNQTPPVYSSLKFRGRRASDLAKKGLKVDMSTKTRLITIYEIDLIQFISPTFTFIVHCSSGTYVRSLVADIGAKLNTVAFMGSLCRTKQGPVFTSETALRQSDWKYDVLINHLLK